MENPHDDLPALLLNVQHWIMNMTSQQTAFLEMFIILSMVMGAMILSTSVASAQTTPVKIGNPNDFRPGPPIPSCNAEFNQGPPGDDIQGCRVSP
jgi:hypothetical protein